MEKRTPSFIFESSWGEISCDEVEKVLKLVPKNKWFHYENRTGFTRSNN